MNNKVLVAMSGGVDSAAAALLIKNAGYETAGVTMKLWSETERVTDIDSGISNADIDDAKRIADALAIPHFVTSLGDSFRSCVIDRFIADYKRGATPNPCVECNKHIDKVELLAYHTMAVSKYGKMGITYRLKGVPPMDGERLKELRKLIEY